MTMGATDMHAATVDRLICCPACLTLMKILAQDANLDEGRCPGCNRVFDPAKGLPPDTTETEWETITPGSDAADAMLPTDDGDSIRKVLIGFMAIAPAYGVIAWQASEHLDGLLFGGFYMAAFAFTIIGSAMLRHYWRNTWSVNLAALVLFELIGVTHFLLNKDPLKPPLEELWIGMLIGGVALLVKADYHICRRWFVQQFQRMR